RTELDCHTCVEVQPLGIAWILHILPTRERFNNQRDSNSFTLAGDFGVASDLLHLELGITGTYDQISENGICAEPQRFLGTREKRAVQRAASVLPNRGPDRCPIQAGNQSGYSTSYCRVCELTDESKIQQQGIDVGLSKLSNLS